MNWRDPDTDLVHAVDYRLNKTDDWFTATPKGVSRWRTMLCGHTVGLNEDGDIDKPGALVLRPFLHTQDVPTCLGCIVVSPETYENDAED